MQHKTDLKKYTKLFNSGLFQNEYKTFAELCILSSSKDYETKDYNFAVRIMSYAVDVKEVLPV